MPNLDSLFIHQDGFYPSECALSILIAFGAGHAVICGTRLSPFAFGYVRLLSRQVRQNVERGLFTRGELFQPGSSARREFISVGNKNRIAVLIFAGLDRRNAEGYVAIA